MQENNRLQEIPHCGSGNYLTAISKICRLISRATHRQADNRIKAVGLAANNREKSSQLEPAGCLVFDKNWGPVIILESRVQYTNIFYKKGALFLHVLRAGQ
jgi:hypothetical protein